MIICVVDDNLTDFTSVQMELKSEGSEWLYIQDDYEKKLLELPVAPDVFIIDVNLIGVTGLDVVRFIRGVENFNESAIVIASGTDKESQERYQKESYTIPEIDLYIVKPVTKEKFKTFMENRAWERVK